MNRSKKHEFLTHVRNLLQTKSHWTKGHVALNHINAEWPVNPKAEDAICWCLQGAAHKFAPFGCNEGTARTLAVAMGFTGTIEMVDWNDHETTTHEMVMERLNKAVEAHA